MALLSGIFGKKGAARDGRPNSSRQFGGRQRLGIADAKDALERFSGADVTGAVARAAIAELDILSRKYHVLEEVVDSRFPRGSLSFDKFMGAVDAAVDVIVGNSMLLAQKMTSFDTEEYRKIRYLDAAGIHSRDGVTKDIQGGKLELLERELFAMKELVESNEKLILDLDRLSFEVGGGNVERGNDDRVAEEIHRLIAEIAMYED